MAKKFIDLDGIAHVWSKIKTLLSGKADTDLNNVTNDNFRDKAIDAGVGGLQTVTASSSDGVTYTATVAGVTALTNGLTITIIPNKTSTNISAQLNLNSLGAKYIRQSTTNNTTTGLTPKNAGWMAANKPITIQYDGTQWKTLMSRSNVSDMNGVLGIANGGTGATTAEQARENLGITEGTLVDTGFIQSYAGTTVPDGWLACNGAAVSRTTYAALFAAISTTYGSGDGSTTFNLPNLNNGSFLEGSNTAGTVKSAGLPNITGSHGVSTDTNANPSLISGAFSYSSASGAHGGDCDQGTGKIIFDASKSNAIYGGSDTVQPKSVTVKFCIKY